MLQIASLSDRGQLTIPAAMRKKLGFSSRDKALIQVEGEMLLVRPVRVVKDVMDLFGSINPRGKTTDPEIAHSAANKIRAKGIASVL